VLWCRPIVVFEGGLLMCTITIQCVTSRCIYEGIPNSDNFEAMDFCICTHSEVGTMSLGGVTDTNSCLYPCLQQHHHYNSPPVFLVFVYGCYIWCGSGEPLCMCTSFSLCMYCASPYWCGT